MPTTRRHAADGFRAFSYFSAMTEKRSWNSLSHVDQVLAARKLLERPISSISFDPDVHDISAKRTWARKMVQKTRHYQPFREATPFPLGIRGIGYTEIAMRSDVASSVNCMIQRIQYYIRVTNLGSVVLLLKVYRRTSKRKRTANSRKICCVVEVPSQPIGLRSAVCFHIHVRH